MRADERAVGIRYDGSAATVGMHGFGERAQLTTIAGFVRAVIVRKVIRRGARAHTCTGTHNTVVIK